MNSSQNRGCESIDSKYRCRHHFVTAYLQAEGGYRLWLRYIHCPKQTIESYRPRIASL